MKKNKRTQIHERLDSLITKLAISRMQFSLRIGRSQAWAGMLLNTNASMTADDLLKIKEVFAVNPLYILEGQKPEFLK